MYAKPLKRASQYASFKLVAALSFTLLTSHTVLGKTEPAVYFDSSVMNKSGIGKLVQMANAMGGLEKILKIKGRQVVSSSTQYEPEQVFKPGDTPIRSVARQNILTHIFTEGKSRNEWNSNIDFPVTVERYFTEIINGKHGAILGVDTLLNIPQAPMQSSRLGARNKQYLMSSPLALLHYAMVSPDKVAYHGITKREDQKYHTVSVTALGHAIKLLLDPVSKLPVWIETREDDFIYGDTLWQINLQNWQKVEGIRVPGELKHYFNGSLLQAQHYSAISLIKTVDESLFVVPEALKQPFNTAFYDWGVRHSQYITRFANIGLPFDLDQTTAATNTVVELSPGVFHYRPLTHNTLIVEMEEYLVAIDPPLYDERTQFVLTDVAQRFPNKPIKYIVASHFHIDHIGGIRGYGAIGANIIVGEGTESHYKAIFDAPHTVYPDAYARDPRPVNITGVSAEQPFIISDGKRRIHLIDIPNRHSIGMLMPYIEDAKMAFVSDLYNPELFPTPIPAQFSFWALDLLDALQERNLEITQLVGAHGTVTSYEKFVSDVTILRENK